MGEGSVSNPSKDRRPSWRLKPPTDAHTQAIVVSGFSGLPYSQALFLFFDWPDGESDAHANGTWLRTLKQVAPITDGDDPESRVATIAFTWTGLQKMGLPPEALATFSAPFREGMYQEDRLRRLGDRIDGEWQKTVIDAGPQWSGNTLARQEYSRDPGELRVGERGIDELKEQQVITPKTVHALLLLYRANEKEVEDWAQEVIDQLTPHNVRVVHRLPLELRLDENRIGREHFGFADGLSQPVPFGEKNDDGSGDRHIVLSDNQPAQRDEWHGVPLGEILIGHINAHHEKAPGPIVKDDPRAKSAELELDGAPENFRNFGLNGSYMVVRELRQDVSAFWKSLDDGAEKIRNHDPKAEHVTADWLAERVVGRNLEGHLLCPSGFLDPDQYGQPQNAFGFKKADPHGHGCPLGSHVRRANPRDSLAKDEASAKTLLDAANNHRILRRGRKYGPTIENRRIDDKRERGLLFICLNTDIARQFEFIQQTWLLNKNFACLYDETDPLVGPAGPFTIREKPLRRIVEVQTFIRMGGGEYFFLPSMPALNYLATL